MSFQHPAQTRTGHQVPALAPYHFIVVTPTSFPSPSVLGDGRSEGSLTIRSGKRSRLRRQLITFDTLPDDVLLEMFDFYVDEDVDEDVDDEDGDHVSFKKHRMEGWITLSHVCRRWRSVVFQSPCRLNLRLVCTSTTCARDILDIWPPLPLIIHDSYFFKGDLSRVENIIAALELNDRVRQIDLVSLTNLEFGHVLDSAAMQKPFPELTHLDLGTDDGPGVPGQILPDSFLGGTAPRLRSLTFLGIPFPGLPKRLPLTSSIFHFIIFPVPGTFHPR